VSLRSLEASASALIATFAQDEMLIVQDQAF
jgi:hypothetical protein